MKRPSLLPRSAKTAWNQPQSETKTVRAHENLAQSQWQTIQKDWQSHDRKMMLTFLSWLWLCSFVLLHVVVRSSWPTSTLKSVNQNLTLACTVIPQDTPALAEPTQTQMFSCQTAMISEATLFQCMKGGRPKEWDSQRHCLPSQANVVILSSRLQQLTVNYFVAESLLGCS